MKVCKCNRCGHVWLPQNGNIKPIACAKCKSSYWNSHRKQQHRIKTTKKPTIPLSNVENKDSNTIYIDLPKEDTQQYAEDIIRKNKPLFDKLAIS